MEFTDSKKSYYHSQIFSSPYNVILGTVFINIGLGHNKHKYFFIYFGKVPIVPTVMEKCRRICKYLQYRHVQFYYNE